ncbi:MAG: SDR family NAD(P)-dependent oxidoreductase [Candidatus Acidiferrales bacterium]
MPSHRELPDLHGQVAIVTGGGRGLGREFAIALAAAGASVGVIARSEHQLNETVSRIHKAGGKALASPGDVASPPAVQKLITEVEEKFGPVDLLVSNAGTVAPIAPIAEADPIEWWHSVEVNVRGTFLSARAVLPGMIARRRGRIIHIASGAGALSFPYLSAYVVGKTAQVRFSEVLAAEVKEHGISVFALQPGTVRTAMSEHSLESPGGKKYLPWFRKIFEEGRDVPPDPAVNLVLLLASGRADSLTGRLLHITDNIADMIERAGEIEREDLYTLRLRKF